MGDHLHACLVAEIVDDVGPVRCGVVVLEPKLVTAVPPELTLAASHTLPHTPQDVSVQMGIH